jgi:predicted small lipoprotein YifL
MKTLVSLGAVATLLALTACGGSNPPVKPVEKNTNAAPAGTMKSPTEGLKERMSASSDASADTKKK